MVALLTSLLIISSTVSAEPNRPESSRVDSNGAQPSAQGQQSGHAFKAAKNVRGTERARRNERGAWVIRDRLYGTGLIDEQEVVIDGVLSPGNSPGCISFGGNVVYTSSSTLIMELEGTTPCTEHDQISIAGNLTINSATLEIHLLNGYVPTQGDTFDIIDWGNLNGSFGTIDTSNAPLPSPLEWDTSSLYLDGTIRVGTTAIGDGDLAPLGSPDGLIDAADVLIAERLVLGQITAGSIQLIHGDMDFDGDIDTADLYLIQRSLVE